MATRKAAPKKATKPKGETVSVAKLDRASCLRTVSISARAPSPNIYLRLANRHGLITGATGTGKTVTLQIMAEGFSAPACRCSAPT